MSRMKNTGEKCSGPECQRVTEKRGYCQSHYQQVYVYGIELRPVALKVACNSHWCSRKRASTSDHGLCNKCKSRFDKYDIPMEDFLNLSGKCDICGSSHMWAIDHDHVTGKVRGILCREHNLGHGIVTGKQIGRASCRERV